MIPEAGSKKQMMEKEEKVHIDTPADHFEQLFARGKDYVETRIDLMKLQAIEKSSDVASSMISRLVVGVIFFLFFIVFNIGLGLLIGDWVDEAWLGFFILAAVYLVAGLVLHASRDKWIKEPVTTKIIRKFFSNGKENHKFQGTTGSDN